MNIEVFATAKIELLSRRLAFQFTRAQKQGDEPSIHDLRVAVRRFEQCSRVFRSVLAERGGKKRRRRLRALLKTAGKLRNLDIAMQLLLESKCNDGNLHKRLMEERKAARKELKCLA
jgi:CHAD domain-containing protein